MSSTVRTANETLLESSDREFDLKEEVRRTERNWKIGKIALVTLGIVFGLLGAWLLIRTPIDPTYVPGSNYVFVGLLWAVAVVCLTAPLVTKFPAPIARIRIGQSRIELLLPSGQGFHQEWSSEAFGLTLRAQLYRPTAGTGAAPRLVLFAPNGWFGTVPEPVAAEIIQAARVRGLPVSTRQETVGRGRARYDARITRIGLPEATPDPV
jgi:hypothetical protein